MSRSRGSGERQPGSGALWARHLLMFAGVVAVIALKRVASGADTRPVLAVIVIDLPSALIFQYSVPVLVFAGSAALGRRISGLTFFRFTAVMWLILVPSLWRLHL